MKKLSIIKSLAHKKLGVDHQNLLRIHQMIILPTPKYGDATYGSASPTTLKTLDPVNHKGVIRLALGKIQRTYKNLHGRESWVRGEHQTKHLEKD
jgi:hypothetical protein